MDEQTASPNGNVNRRTIVAAAAWTVPVWATAATAPFSAASPASEELSFGPDRWLGPEDENPFRLRGHAPLFEGARPAQIDLTYTAGLSGPSTVPVDESGDFTVLVDYPTPVPGSDVTGAVVATGPGMTTVSVSIRLTGANPAPQVVTGSIQFSPVQYFGVERDGAVFFPTLTGTVAVSSGTLPAEVELTYSDPNERVSLSRIGGNFVPIDQVTGAFAVDGVYNSVTGGENPFGFIYAGVRNAGSVTYGLSVAELDG